MQNELEARAVESVVIRVAHFIDARRWTELAALFAAEVETDYTSLFGGQPQKQPAAELVLGGWQKLLEPLERTQHLLGPIDVTTGGDRATAECHVRAYHRSRRNAGGDEWMVAGHYIFELVKAGSAWKIRKLTLDAYYQTGNTKLLQEAAERQ
jgi:3-phenylpropionate/cinnamic acid dioxygenase small subunit